MPVGFTIEILRFMSEKKHNVFTFSQSGKKPEWVCIEVEQMLNTFDIKIVCGELIVRKRNLSKSIHLQHIYLAREFHIANNSTKFLQKI